MSSRMSTFQKATLQEPEKPRIEKGLIKWFIKQRWRNLLISEDMIKAETKKVNSGFKAIPGEFSGLISLKRDTE